MTLQRPIGLGSAVLDDLAEVIGRDAVRRLVEALGGTGVYVPRSIGRNNPIMLAIGPTAATKLAEHYHGTVIQLPKAHARRRRALELAKDPEITIRDAALATDYSERRLYQLLEQDRRAEEDGQGDLFD